MTDDVFNPDGPDIPDLRLGLPGPAEPQPDDDQSQHEPTRVNDEDAPEGR